MRDFSSTVVFRWLVAGDAGELDAFNELLHPDAVILRHEVQEVVVEGDVEMARVVVTGTLTSSFGGIEGTGRSFRIDQAVITHLRDGKVSEAWEIADIAGLKSAGERRLIQRALPLLCGRWSSR